MNRTAVLRFTPGLLAGLSVETDAFFLGVSSLFELEFLPLFLPFFGAGDAFSLSGPLNRRDVSSGVATGDTSRPFLTDEDEVLLGAFTPGLKPDLANDNFLLVLVISCLKIFILLTLKWVL